MEDEDDRPQGDRPPQGLREIEVVAEAKSIGRHRKIVLTGQSDTSKHALVSDEGSYLPGGEGTAPTPLAYFAAGVAL